MSPFGFPSMGNKPTYQAKQLHYQPTDRISQVSGVTDSSCILSISSIATLHNPGFTQASIVNSKVFLPKGNKKDCLTLTNRALA